PDLEAAEFLSRREPVPPVLPLAGHLEYVRKEGKPLTLGLLRGSVPGSTEGWIQAQDELGRYFEAVRSTPGLLESVAPPGRRIAWSATLSTPPEIQRLIGHYLESARKMGEATAAVHKAFGSADGDPDLAPEPFTSPRQRSIYQTLRKKATRAILLLRRTLKALSPDTTGDSKRFLALEARLLQAFQSILKKRLASVRIRCHGDLTLSRFLSTGSDFVITDWGGPVTGPFLDRRLKRSPLWDVASMLNSFRCAANTALTRQISSGEVAPDRWPTLLAGAAGWYAGVSAGYADAYRKAVEDARFGLGDAEEWDLLLRIELLEKILDEMAAASGAPGAGAPLLLKELSDLLDALESPSSAAPEAVPPQAAWPEAAEWMRYLQGPDRSPGAIPAAPPPAATAPPQSEPPFASPVPPTA
ncbi:MAG TPA: hypothetical protein VG457_04260, partial [Planctomycetota bacterium]|nr:hypothetical protein [Planctomycetota bacterium]